MGFISGNESGPIHFQNFNHAEVGFPSWSVVTEMN